MCALGAKRDSICAAMGASIGRCCFETDGDVPAAVEKYLGGEADGLFDAPRRKMMVDLRAANARRLVQLGLRRENIDVSEECTVCSHDKYWSHRYAQARHGKGKSCRGDSACPWRMTMTKLKKDGMHTVRAGAASRLRRLRPPRGRGTYDTIPESTGGRDVERAVGEDDVFSLNSNSNYSFNPSLRRTAQTSSYARWCMRTWWSWTTTST